MGKWIPVAETNPTALDADHDPYVLWRQIRHKLFRAVDEENVLNEQLLALQKRCQHYETLLVQAIQKALKGSADQVSKESQYSLNVANELSGTHLPLLFTFSESSDRYEGSSCEGMGSIFEA